MKKMNPLLVLGAALVFSLAAWGQQSSNQQTGSTDNQAANSNQRTIRGCVTGDVGTYVVLDETTGVSYLLRGHQDEIGKQIHHEVEVIGQPVPGTHSAPASSGKTGTKLPPTTLKVQSIREISNHCPPPQSPPQ